METINIKTDPMCLNIENETVLVMFMAKGTEASMYARIPGNVDVRVVNDIQLKIPRSSSEGRTAATTEETYADGGGRDVQYDKPSGSQLRRASAIHFGNVDEE